MSFADNIILLSDSAKATHWWQYPPGTQYVYSYFESDGSDREGWEDVVFFGLQYFLKRYLTGQVITKEKIEQAGKIYAQHFGNGIHENPGRFFKEGWEYILDTHGGHLPIKIKALPEGQVVPTNTVLMTVVNTDPRCYWLTSFVESLLTQVWYSITMCTVSRMMKLCIQRGHEETGCEKLPMAVPNFQLHDIGFQSASSVESAALNALSHLVNFTGSDSPIANILASEFYGATEATGYAKPSVIPSTIITWGPEGELEAMRNILDHHGSVSCSSDSFDTMTTCQKYWGEALRDKIIDRCHLEEAIAKQAEIGQLYVRLERCDPDEIVGVLKILLEKFPEMVFSTGTGHKVLPPYVRVWVAEGGDYKSIPPVLQRLKEEGIATVNLRFGRGSSQLKADRDTFKLNFKCSEVVGSEAREVGTAKKGKLTLQKADSIDLDSSSGYPANSLGDNTGFLHFSKDGKYVTIASGRGNPEKDLLVDVFENGQLLKEYTFSEIRQRAEVPNGKWCVNPPEYYKKG